MSLGASICIAAEREAFQVELNRSVESISSLDTLIIHGWSSLLSPESPNNSAFHGEPKELIFVLSAYLGTIFVLHRAAEWRFENGKPALFFRSIDQSEYPFELAELKLRDPERVNLSQETARWGFPPEAAPADGNEQPTE